MTQFALKREVSFSRATHTVRQPPTRPPGSTSPPPDTRSASDGLSEPPHPYSARSALTGSTRAARRAGK